MSIQAIDSTTRGQVDDIIRREWNGPISVSRGVALDTSRLPGFVWAEGGAVLGAVTCNLAGGDCEIVTLNSLAEDRGIGGALIGAALTLARENGCRRLWLITTNDNTRAIRYYQKRGFALKAVHIDAMELSRKLKPSIPLTGMDGLPLQHEFEFEILL